jgi:hypothetical protein
MATSSLCEFNFIILNSKPEIIENNLFYNTFFFMYRIFEDGKNSQNLLNHKNEQKKKWLKMSITNKKNYLRVKNI